MALQLCQEKKICSSNFKGITFTVTQGHFKEATHVREIVSIWEEEQKKKNTNIASVFVL